MCVGGTRIGMCLGEMAYTVERFFACIALTAVVTTIVFTLLWMLGAGVGLGYNYCYVESKLNQTLRLAKAYKDKGTTIARPRTSTLLRQKRSKDLIPKPLEKPLYLDTYQVFNRPEKENFETVKISNKYWRLKQMVSSTDSNIEIKPTIVVPLRHFGLIILIKKLQKQSSNFTLELITGNS